MNTIRTLRVAVFAFLFAFPLGTVATVAEAAPAGPAHATELAGPALATAGVTIGRHRALPKKKRIHHQRKL